jgi:hypothetical protein
MPTPTPFRLSAVVCLALCIPLGCDTRNRSVNTAKPTGEAKQPLFTPEAASLSQQKMCDEQAAKRFHENENSDDFHLKKKNPPISDYTSHYDPAVNVCYVRIHSITANPATVGDTVYDAFGGRVFASYVWVNPQGKTFWEVSPSECTIHIPGKPDEKCKTDTEFDELTEKYFGVTQ